LDEAERTRYAAWKNRNAPPRYRTGSLADAKEECALAIKTHAILEKRVIETRAFTAEGALAKLKRALDEFDSGEGGGTIMASPISAIRDAVAVIGLAAGGDA
jgi:hypothetical protein